MMTDIDQKEILRAMVIARRRYGITAKVWIRLGKKRPFRVGIETPKGKLTYGKGETMEEAFEDAQRKRREKKEIFIQQLVTLSALVS